MGAGAVVIPAAKVPAGKGDPLMGESRPVDPSRYAETLSDPAFTM